MRVPSGAAHLVKVDVQARPVLRLGARAQLRGVLPGEGLRAVRGSAGAALRVIIGLHLDGDEAAVDNRLKIVRRRDSARLTVPSVPEQTLKK